MSHGGEINLQAHLSASSVTSGPLMPHHPITCTSDLRLHPDGRFECEHGAVGGDDARTQACLDHSIALLLIELAAGR